MKSFCILGQNNNAVSIILDTLAAGFPLMRIRVDIVANIDPAENETLVYAYKTPGVSTRELFYTEWNPEPCDGYFLGTFGNARRAIFQFFAEKFSLPIENFPSSIHPSAVCSPSVQTGFGLHISPLSVVAPHAVLGNFVVVNRNVSVGHHTVLEHFVSLRPGVNVAGNCRIGEGAAIGAGATILDKINIGANTVIGAGAVVTKDIPANVVAYGVPAKIIRELERSC